ncbi:MAG: membrane bound O-acyl transferase family-domain-containing protein [Raineya sp.]|jgi:alginate O-acetyltransferase complex protein AlgI|nr:membrane bound O-acyl transferase family-domain-containing protein [Raineya sp.]
MDINLIILIVWGLFLWIGGYAIGLLSDKNIKRVLTWGLAILTTIGSILLSAGLQPLYRMLVIVSLQLIAMKPIVLIESYPQKSKLNFIQWSGFALGWFGMRPILFEKFKSTSLNKTTHFFVKGISRILLGISIIFLANKITFDMPANLLRLVGLSFILHFGVLNISTGWWRKMGVDVKELFIAPYQSKSLKEFWGKRWNMAFSEMTALIVYKPLKTRLGIHGAMFVSFLMSGILHEIAISFPVGRGYGLPLLYFLIHGILMYLESKLLWIKKIVEQPVLSRLWVYFWLVVPITLLFHEKFINEVIQPLCNLILMLLNLN